MPNVTEPTGKNGPTRTAACRSTKLAPTPFGSLRSKSQGREKYARSWFAHGGEPEQQQTVTDPTGYVAPPLDGIWASAPYFHNGSVPTIWGVLSPEDRPRVWRPTSLEMDAEKVGLQFEAVEKIPFGIQDIAIKRAYFDTARFGKSNAGHNFGNVLSDQEKQAVIEYLKTL